MRLLVTGSRHFQNEDLVWIVFYDLDLEYTPTLIVGDCPTGLDRIALEAATHMRWPIEQYWADWDEYGKAAGPIRNQEMVDSGADLCYGFLVPGEANVGTRGCMAKAKKAGIPVHEFWE